MSEKLSLLDENENLSFNFSICNIQNSISDLKFTYKLGESKYTVSQNGQSLYIAGKNKSNIFGNILPYRCYGFKDGTLDAQRLISPLQTQFENLFHCISYLGPLREYPRSHYSWEGKHTPGVGKRGEDMVAALFSGRIQLRSTEEEVPKWLERLDLIDSYRLNPVSHSNMNYEILVRKYENGPEVRLTDVGFGVSQVLPVLVLCYYVPKGSILILEQPEAHLHPRVQSELADLLIEVVKNRNLQIILESHSENLIVRLMRRVAEEQISKDDTAFYFCEMNEGTSEFEKLDMDDYGNITNWPENFFGDVTGDLIEKTKAEMKRKKEQGL